MITRSNYQIEWCYSDALPIAADIALGPGINNSSISSPFLAAIGITDVALVNDLPYFSLNVWTDEAVLIDIQTGYQFTNIATMCTLTCNVGASVNTCYDLPAPWNRDGFLIITGNYLRIRVRNTTGAIVSPFELQARSWR